MLVVGSMKVAPDDQDGHAVALHVTDARTLGPIRNEASLDINQNAAPEGQRY
jgi:hypothetical protein